MKPLFRCQSKPERGKFPKAEKYTLNSSSDHIFADENNDKSNNKNPTRTHNFDKLCTDHPACWLQLRRNSPSRLALQGNHVQHTILVYHDAELSCFCDPVQCMHERIHRKSHNSQSLPCQSSYSSRKSVSQSSVSQTVDQSVFSQLNNKSVLSRSVKSYVSQSFSSFSNTVSQSFLSQSNSKSVFPQSVR